MATGKNNEEDPLTMWIEKHPATVLYIAIMVTVGLIVQLVDLYVSYAN